MSVQSLLISTLDDMLAEDLRKFKFWLSNDLPEGFKPIGKGRLENKSVEDIVEQMIAAFGEKDAGKVALHALRKADQNDLALELEKNLDVAPSVPPCPVGQNGGSSTATTPLVSIQNNNGKVQAPVLSQMNIDETERQRSQLKRLKFLASLAALLARVTPDLKRADHAVPLSALPSVSAADP
ncbi:hypothetical protein COCON_G00206930 [Conger conger]|uniref:Pyrin domain-containing protein n=1 Tax=Conger conger TaxID=82655 RepID=A0A9Q1CZU6_CONCO|nr:hypothetical protein COCON_G00206930 [Conger conger]